MQLLGQHDAGFVDFDLWPGTSSGQTGFRPLLNQTTLELSKRRRDSRRFSHRIAEGSLTLWCERFGERLISMLDCPRSARNAFPVIFTFLQIYHSICVTKTVRFRIDL